jgi:hypothetical protein
VHRLAWAAVLCRTLVGVPHVTCQRARMSRGGAVVYLSKEDLAVLMVSSDLRSTGPMGRSV